MFNPNKYSVEKGVQWQEHRAPGLNLPELEFTSGDPETLSLDLFIDTSRTDADVRTHTEKLRTLTLINKDKHRPPIVEFQWGTSFRFKGVITKMTSNFTMFSAKGYPIRANISLSIKQAMTVREQKTETQNQSPDHTKVHVVRQGETIDSIAAREYDDPIHWKLIAEANDLENPSSLSPGQRLTLPRLF
jgi:nucleoid-associated protein YgaU